MRAIRWIGRIILYGLAALGGLTVAGLVAVAIFAGRLQEPVAELPDSIVLSVDFRNGVVEGPKRGLLPNIGGGGENVLRDVVEALEAAAKDDRVKGLVARFGGERIDLAHAQELRDAVAAFRKSGKFTKAFAESFGGLRNGTVEYYLAAAFEQVWLQPSGNVGLIGAAIEMPFLKGALEKLDVETRIEQRHEYKSAAELLTRSGLSEPARRSLKRLVESWLVQIVRGIAEDRRLGHDTVNRLVDTGPHLGADARQLGLVDRHGYWDEVVSAVQKDARTDVKLISVNDYLAAAGRPNAAGPRVALIYGVGPIVPGRERPSPFTGTRRFHADTVGQAISDAIEDDSIKAILFRVDSPGGAYVPSDSVWRKLKYARSRGKLVIVSMGHLAASGGYFVAMAADKIVAQPGTVTGSIGVYGGKLVTEAFWDKLGIRWDGVQAGKRARMWSQIGDYPPGAKERVGQLLDSVYDDFTNKAAKSRGLTDDQIDAMARGRVWTGADAKERGLVDELGGFRVAIGLIKERLGLAPEDPIDIVVLPRPLSPIEQVLEAIQDGGIEARSLVANLFGSGPLGGELGTIIETLDLLSPVGVLQAPPFRLAR
ncbi:MAG: signal peptide peptidase SppA [Alphaproteobacteria bacterium]|jgi:protease-4|nr:signal peptide peptidase SppA [Alphaproteobacteria bacterium]